MAKRQAATVRAATSESDLVEILAVTGDDPDTLRHLIALCDAIIARRSDPSVAFEIDASPLSVT